MVSSSGLSHSLPVQPITAFDDDDNQAMVSSSASGSRTAHISIDTALPVIETVIDVQWQLDLNQDFETLFYVSESDQQEDGTHGLYSCINMETIHNVGANSDRLSEFPSVHRHRLHITLPKAPVLTTRQYEFMYYTFMNLHRMFRSEYGTLEFRFFARNPQLTDKVFIFRDGPTKDGIQRLLQSLMSACLACDIPLQNAHFVGDHMCWH